MNGILKAVKWVAVLLCVVAAVGGLWLNSFVNSGRPQYSGQADLPGLGAEVTVYRDAMGVPHIMAGTETDAYMALGYVHAQERLFEMILMRHMVSGRAAELFGDIPFHQARLPIHTMLELDRFNRAAGFKHFADVYVPKMKPQERAVLDAYVNGVNAYLKTVKKLPPEFGILKLAKKYEVQPWTAEDVVALGRYVGWFLSHNWDSELFRLQAVKSLGLERGWELMPRHEHPGPYIIPNEDNPYYGKGRGKKIDPLYVPPGMKLDDIPADMFASLLDLNGAIITSNLPFNRPYASNNWAVSPRRSKSGHAILSNDPHLSHMLPSIFFEAHLKAKAGGLDAIGVTFPGMPFVVLGHNRHVAWAATTTRGDNQDLFIERVNPKNPDQYWDPVKNAWRAFDIREEVIYVSEKKAKKKIVLRLRVSRHGPILNDVMGDRLSKSAPPVALSWGGFTNRNGHLAFQQVAHAGSAGEVMKTLEKMDVPIQNWVFADDAGHIGYYAAGLYPIRPEGCDGTLPVRGDTTQCDWLGFAPPEMQPRMLDPEQGYIISANNKVVDETEFPIVVSFNYPGYRAWRIEQLLTSKDKLTPSDMRRFQLDTYMLQAKRLLPFYLRACDNYCKDKDAVMNAALEALREWDMRADVDSVGSTIYHAVYDETFRLTFADDMTPQMYELAADQAPPWIALDNAIESGKLSFFDTKGTQRVETRDDILAAAVLSGINKLKKNYGDDVSKWTWGRVHTLTFAHPLSAMKPLDLVFKEFTNPAPGDGTTIFNQHYAPGGDDFPVQHGPAWRHVIDMGSVDDAAMILDAGQSGHPRSSHFFDQNPLWLVNKQIPMYMTERDILKNSTAVLRLKPVKKK